MTILDHFVREVLPDVDVLRPFTFSDDIVASFNAGVVFLVDRCPSLRIEPHVDEETPNIEGLYSSFRCRVVFRLRSG